MDNIGINVSYLNQENKHRRSSPNNVAITSNILVKLKKHICYSVHACNHNSKNSLIQNHL